MQVNFDVQFVKIDIIFILKYCLFRPERWFCAPEFVCFEHVISNLLNTMFNANESLISCVLNPRCSHKNYKKFKHFRYFLKNKENVSLIDFDKSFWSFGKNCQVLRVSEFCIRFRFHFLKKVIPGNSKLSVPYNAHCMYIEKLTKWHFWAHAWNFRFFWPKAFFWSNMKMAINKNFHNMSQGSPNLGFMHEKVQKGDFLKKTSRKLKNYSCFRFLWIPRTPERVN